MFTHPGQDIGCFLATDSRVGAQVTLKVFSRVAEFGVFGRAGERPENRAGDFDALALAPVEAIGLLKVAERQCRTGKRLSTTIGIILKPKEAPVPHQKFRRSRITGRILSFILPASITGLNEDLSFLLCPRGRGGKRLNK